MSGFNLNHTETSGVSNTTIQAHVNSLSKYRDNLKRIVASENYEEPESALSLPGDESMQETTKEVVSALTSLQKPKLVIVIGMGGSIRGTKAAYKLLANEETSKMIFIDSVDVDKIKRLQKLSAHIVNQPEDIVICSISKSGKTTETIANTNCILAKLSGQFDIETLYKRTLVISKEDSELDDLAKKNNINRLHIPSQVGGRFSVLSPVGIAPLELAGISTDELLAGGKSMREACLSGRPISDPAATVAAILFDHAEDGRRILNHYYFNQRAAALGKWSAQLFAESLGKKKNKKGEAVFSGMYPTTSIAPSDLHSLFQLQLGGPKNFITIFVRSLHDSSDTEIPDAGLFPDDLAYLGGKNMSDVQNSLTKATLQAFKDAGRPYIDIVFSQFTAERIGQILVLEEIVVMYLGELLDVNAFDQPEVERYKKHARDNLKS